jgi:hypothetical protein
MGLRLGLTRALFEFRTDGLARLYSQSFVKVGTAVSASTVFLGILAHTLGVASQWNKTVSQRQKR